MTTSDSRRRRRWHFVLEHKLDAAAIDRILAPGGLRRESGRRWFYRRSQDAKCHIGHAFVGQHDQPGQIALQMPKLTLVVKQVAEYRGVVTDHGRRAP